MITIQLVTRIIETFSKKKESIYRPISNPPPTPPKKNGVARVSISVPKI